MKTPYRIVLFLAGLIGLILTSCQPTDQPASGDDPRDPFVGVWQLVENGGKKSIQGQSYIVTISKDLTNSSQLVIKNFGNPGVSNANVTGIVTTNQIVVSSQLLTNGWVVEGSGKISNASKTAMAWTYNITAGGDKLYYTATASKE